MTWMMARMVGEPGRSIPALASFALLTGWRFSPADMLWSGLATDYVPSEDLGEFMDTVIAESLDDAPRTLQHPTYRGVRTGGMAPRDRRVLRAPHLGGYFRSIVGVR